MRAFISLAATGAVLATAGSVSAAEAPTLRVRNAVAVVRVIPENRSDVSVTINQGQAPLPVMHVSQSGRDMVVDGGVNESQVSCSGPWMGVQAGRLGLKIKVRGQHAFPLKDAPVITVHMPREARLETGGAVFGEVGETDSLMLAARGCGDWTLGAVHHALQLSMAGSGDVAAQTSGALSVSIAGSGDFRIDRVGEGADMAIAGSGDIKAGRIDGPIRAAIRGSGDMTIPTGKAPSVQISIAGSGDFSFGGEAGSVQAATAGSGDI